MNYLNIAKERQNNEFYTLYESVQFIVEKTYIKDYLYDKIVYLPCDTEESNIYKYLMDNKEKLHIKEILRTEDDYYKHLDLYEKADVVFTNPPFTGLWKWMKFLEGINKKYIIWYPFIQLYNRNLINKYIILATDTYKEKFLNKYILPDNTYKDVNCLIISNDKYFKDHITYNKDYKIQAFKYTFDEIKNNICFKHNYLWIDKSKYIPKDYYDPICIPPAAYARLYQYFDYIDYIKDITLKQQQHKILVKLKQINK